MKVYCPFPQQISASTLCFRGCSKLRSHRTLNRVSQGYRLKGERTCRTLREVLIANNRSKSLVSLPGYDLEVASRRLVLMPLRFSLVFSFRESLTVGIESRSYLKVRIQYDYVRKAAY